MGRAGSHAFSIDPPNLRGAQSYQSMAGGSVATRCTSPSRALEAAAVCDAAKGSRRAVLGATFIDSNDSFGYVHPETWLSGNVHASA